MTVTPVFSSYQPVNARANTGVYMGANASVHQGSARAWSRQPTAPSADQFNPQFSTQFKPQFTGLSSKWFAEPVGDLPKSIAGIQLTPEQVELIQWLLYQPDLAVALLDEISLAAPGDDEDPDPDPNLELDAEGAMTTLQALDTGADQIFMLFEQINQQPLLQFNTAREVDQLVGALNWLHGALSASLADPAADAALINLRRHLNDLPGEGNDVLVLDGDTRLSLQMKAGLLQRKLSHNRRLMPDTRNTIYQWLRQAIQNPTPNP